MRNKSPKANKPRIRIKGHKPKESIKKMRNSLNAIKNLKGRNRDLFPKKRFYGNDKNNENTHTHTPKMSQDPLGN